MSLRTRRSSVRSSAGAGFLMPSALTRSARLVPVLGLLRLGVGALLLARPDTAARALGVDRVTARRTAWLGSLVAVREVALGLGALQAGGHDPGRTAPWVAAQAVADAGDAVAFLSAAARGQVRASRAVTMAAIAIAAVACEAIIVRDLLRARLRCGSAERSLPR